MYSKVRVLGVEKVEKELFGSNEAFLVIAIIYDWDNESMN